VGSGLSGAVRVKVKINEAESNTVLLQVEP
jgi:hypothetical protein